MSTDPSIGLVLGLPHSYYAKVSTWFQVGYSLSFISALAVLLTGILFWKDMVRDKIYMKLLMLMSLFDALASTMGTFGIDTRSNFICVTQGIMWFFFNRASWLCCVGITATLFTQVRYDRIFVQFNSMALCILVINVVLILTPLLATDYMNYGGYGHCSFNIGGLVHNGEQTGHIVTPAFGHVYNVWYAYMLVIPLATCVGVTLSLVIYMYVSIYHRTLDIYDESAKYLLKAVKSVLFYPIIMAIFWVPTFVAKLFIGNLGLYSLQGQGHAIKWINGTLIWSSFYSVGIAIYFFHRSDEARSRWREKLGLNSGANGEKEVDLQVDDEGDKIMRKSLRKSSARPNLVNVYDNTGTENGQTQTHETYNPTNLLRVKDEDEDKVEL